MKTQKMIIEQGIIARQQEDLLGYFGWPTVCSDENGVLYAVVSRRMVHVCPFGQYCLYRSTDGGKTWSEPQVVVDDAFDDRDAGICYLGDGKMIMSYFTHDLNRYAEGGIYSWWMRFIPKYGTEEAKKRALDAIAATPEDQRYGASYIRVSKDYGKTWGEKVHLPISAPHGPTKLKDGRLLYVGTPHEVEAYQRATGDTTEYTNSVIAMVSEDEGATWKKLADISMPPETWNYPAGHFYMCEAHVVERQNGHLLVAIRKGDNNETLRRSEKEVVYLSHSQNGGKTWSTAEPLTNCDGQVVIGAPPHLFETADGAIVLSYSRRVAPTSNRAILSYDGGYNWGEEIILSASWNPECDDLGYPATTQLPSGELVTVYYQRYFDDARPSFLYTKWNPKKQ
ncbi:MAG: exo-alpha-sialidase [Clostridia bacterium]|nr:exo-alpha-sialidase [Clostridia bacterium]